MSDIVSALKNAVMIRLRNKRYDCTFAKLDSGSLGTRWFCVVKWLEHPNCRCVLQRNHDPAQN